MAGTVYESQAARDRRITRRHLSGIGGLLVIGFWALVAFTAAFPGWWQ